MALLLRGGLLVGVVASLLGLLAPFWPFWELANHFRPFVLLGALVLAALAFWRGFSSITGLAIGLVTLNSLLLLPGFMNMAGTASLSVSEDSRQLKILTFNMWGRNKNVAQVIDLIRQEDADIVMLQEFFDFHAAKIIPKIRKQYPFIYSCAGERSCNIALVSKKKWSKISHVGWTRDHPPLIDAVFSDKHILVTHTAYPFLPNKQKRDMAWLTKYVRDIKKGKPVIIGGDMNLSPWSWKMHLFQSRTELKRHTTFLHSWPAHRLMPFVQLDHILSSSHFRSVSVRTGDFAGSDHLPVIVTLSMP